MSVLRKYYIIFFMLFIFCMNIYTHASAKIVDVEGVGKYIVEKDSVADISYAEECAHKEAIRNAAESAGVYIVSSSTVKDRKLIKDQIEIIANNLLKIDSSIQYKEIYDNKIQIVCIVKAKADTESIEKRLTEEINDIKRKYKIAIEKINTNNEMILNLFNNNLAMNELSKKEYYNICKNVYEFNPDNRQAREEMLIVGLDEKVAEITETDVRKYIKDYPNDFLGWALLNKITPNQIYIKKAYELISIIPEMEYYKNVKPLLLHDEYIWGDDYRFESKWVFVISNILLANHDYHKYRFDLNEYEQDGKSVMYLMETLFHPKTDIDKYEYEDLIKILEDVYKDDLNSSWFLYMKENYRP